MAKKNLAIKHLIDAHGWLGVIFSLVLFLVFWAGAASLFRADIQRWAEVPHDPVELTAQDLPVLELIENTVSQFPFDSSEHLTVSLPGEYQDHYLMFIDLIPSEDTTDHFKAVKVNPKTGDIMGESKQFSLSRFLFILHINMNMGTVGAYFIGIVTLFFLFAIFSGIYIHAKKIIDYFFAYRKEKRRTQTLDLHNVVGIISLPYTLMYAITGLIFNLAIVFQITFTLFLYDGDTEKLTRDAGFVTGLGGPNTGIAQSMEPVLDLKKAVEEKYGPVLMMRFFNYGDEAAVVQFRGESPDAFANRFDVYYRVKDGELVFEGGSDFNTLQQGLEVMDRLHFGSFAEMDLRVLYFILAMMVCAMIIAGNLLWIEKRYRNKRHYGNATRWVSAITLGGCAGLMLATALAFVLERGLPTHWDFRSDILKYTFTACCLLCIALDFRMQNKRRFLARMFNTTAALFCLTVVLDWLLYSSNLIQLWQQQRLAAIGTEIGFLLLAACCFYTARLLTRAQNTQAVTDSDSMEASA